MYRHKLKLVCPTQASPGRGLANRSWGKRGGARTLSHSKPIPADRVLVLSFQLHHLTTANLSQLSSRIMRLLSLALFAAATMASAAFAAADPSSVQVEVLHAVSCDRKTQKGDTISVHYRGTLAADGSEFDASYNRGTPLTFTVGTGQVIKGCVLNGFRLG